MILDMKLTVLLLAVLSIHEGSSYGNVDVRHLTKDLFTTSGYNKKVRPSLNFSEPILIYIDLYLMSINRIEAVAGKLTTTAYLQVLWQDEYLTWNPVDYNGINTFYVPQKEIWRPDFSLLNGFTKLKDLGDEFLLADVRFDGIVYWRPFEVFESKCTIDILHFPFDKQTCNLTFGAWMPRLDDIDVEIGRKGIIMDEYHENDEWELMSTSALATETSEEGAKVIFTINLKRNARYYILNIIIPISFLSILVTFTFVIPLGSGEKMGYTVTVYLAFAVFLTIINSSLPVSSDPSIMGIYLVFLLTLGNMIIMITCLELRLHHRDSSRPISSFWCWMVNANLRVRCSTNRHDKRLNATFNDKSFVKNREQDANTSDAFKTTDKNQQHGIAIPENEEDKNNIKWSDVTAAIDFFCFVIFVTIIIATSSILLLYGLIFL